MQTTYLFFIHSTPLILIRTGLLVTTLSGHTWLNIAGYDLLDFYDLDLNTGEIVFSDKFTNSTIYNLMYQKTNMPHSYLSMSQ